MKIEKAFDAVEMMRQIRDAQYEQTKDMTREERLAYYREQGGKAQKELERLTNKREKQKSRTRNTLLHDFQATLLYLLGIDHERLTFKHQGRRYRLTDVSGNVVKSILA